MPRPSEDRWFGGKAGSAAKAYRAMVDRYGAEKGERVYQALLTKRRAQGLDDGSGGLRAQLRRKARQSR
jgi:hypothetical protein